jgi:hypothetical protein
LIGLSIQHALWPNFLDQKIVSSIDPARDTRAIGGRRISLAARDVQMDRAYRPVRNPAQIWPGMNPAQHIVNWARISPARSLGRAGTKGVARWVRGGTARFYFFYFFI